MDNEQLIDAVGAALIAVISPHYYEDERGFQGAFYAQLHYRLQEMVLPEGAMLREEYQKKLSQHRLRIRPDIILHEPFDPARHLGRDDGNHAVIELKRHAITRTAKEALESLVAMIEALNYPLGVFINVDSTRTWSELVPEAFRTQIVCLAISLDESGAPRLMRD